MLIIEYYDTPPCKCVYLSHFHSNQQQRSSNLAISSSNDLRPGRRRRAAGAVAEAASSMGSSGVSSISSGVSSFIGKSRGRRIRLDDGRAAARGGWRFGDDAQTSSSLLRGPQERDRERHGQGQGGGAARGGAEADEQMGWQERWQVTDAGASHDSRGPCQVLLAGTLAFARCRHILRAKRFAYILCEVHASLIAARSFYVDWV